MPPRRDPATTLRALTCTAALLGTAAAAPAESAALGSFDPLRGWTGLTADEGRTPDGAATARWDLAAPATFTYSDPQTYFAGNGPEFSDMVEEVAVGDWYRFRYLAFDVELPDDRPLELTCTVRPLKLGRPEFVESLSTTATVRGAGWQAVLLPLRNFDHLTHQATFWQYIQSVSLTTGDAGARTVRLSGPRLRQAPRVALGTAVSSRPIEPGGAAEYAIAVQNETAQAQDVTLSVEQTGWEACPATLSHDTLTLDPYATQTVTLSVAMNDRVAPGGREDRRVTAVPNGRGDLKTEHTFTTVRRLPHPYLMHTDAGWHAVTAKADRVDWARDARQRYLDDARAWRVPTIRSGAWNYRHRDAEPLMACAVAWKLSGDEALADKVLTFLRDLSDPERGFPVTRRVNSGSHVHQGMFFVRVAQAYDLLHDHPDLTDGDHRQIAATLRLFNAWVDAKILTGDGNNHQVGLVAGATLNALVLQDFAQVDRFLHGTGGYRDLLAAGILDDGNYFEGTANYNLLTANICNAVAVACEAWSMGVKDWQIPARHGSYAMIPPWGLTGEFLGMSFQKHGPATRSHRALKDLWDAVLPMSDYRGVVFPSADSVSIDLREGAVAGGFGYDMAYYLWRDPAYLPVIHRIRERNLIYGVPDLPEASDDALALGRASYVADNAGFAVLRSKSEGRPDRERIQAVQRYGTHGGYHGHFDKTSLVSLWRYGRTPYGTEASWYGYWSFMFKMWVQASSSHPMVVVDHRMQKPADNRRLLFHSGDLMQASAAEIETVWIDPPYGGQTPYALKMPEEKTWDEARWLPTPENPRPQGDTGTPSEPIRQRRLIVVTDDYVVMADHLRGTREHDFDHLFNAKGLVGLTAAQKVHVKHTAQADPNPYRAAQFITDCTWYDTAGPVTSAFVLDWDKGDMGGRNSHSEPGQMNLDHHVVWPAEAGVMVGNYPESLDVARQLFYRVLGDGEVLDEGRIAPWILGKVELDVDVRGVRTLEIETTLKKAGDPKTIFLGSPALTTADGAAASLDSVPVTTDNIAAADPGRDYAGGRITIFGEDHATALAAEPADRDAPGRLTFDLSGQNAARFSATLGGDYPVGGDDIHRKVIATRVTGREARFLSVIEIHEDAPVIASLEAPDADTLVVHRHDGRTETFRIRGLESDDGVVSVALRVEEHGRVVATEQTD